MLESKIKEIRQFCISNANPEIVKKYSRYFKEGYDGFGIDTKVFEKQRDFWIEAWNEELGLKGFLDLGDLLMKDGKLEEKSLAIWLLNSKRDDFTEETFHRVGLWFDMGVDNWATCDVLCMLVMPFFFESKVVDFEALMEWNKAESEWQRRAVPVTLVELNKGDLVPEEAFKAIEPLMLDESEYVQKGIGTLLRGLWKKHPNEVDEFLMKWKDECGRLIVQYATEKMDKDYRKKFRKEKKNSRLRFV